ncbi:hypothetical protein TNCV_827631 [Trichonephila clavipes]|nr:hypothetical protein TNCV_827631 [Trichonephila clavipes]
MPVQVSSSSPDEANDYGPRVAPHCENFLSFRFPVNHQFCVKYSVPTILKTLYGHGGKVVMVGPKLRVRVSPKTHLVEELMYIKSVETRSPSVDVKPSPLPREKRTDDSTSGMDDSGIVRKLVKFQGKHVLPNNANGGKCSLAPIEGGIKEVTSRMDNISFVISSRKISGNYNSSLGVYKAPRPMALETPADGWILRSVVI